MTLPLEDKDSLNDHDLFVLIAESYNRALNCHGPCAKGVLWSEDEAQIKRFEILSSIITPKPGLKINDYGCGFGAFYDFLLKKQVIDHTTFYYGYDISAKMLKALKTKHPDNNKIVTVLNNKIQTVADYSFSSGTFGLKLDTEVEKWKTIVKASILNLDKYSTLGFAFNILDEETQKPKQPGLFYANKQEFMEFCKSKFSGRIKLITGYCIDDFTITVTKFV